MGLFDLPAPVLNFVDGVYALVLPDIIRILIWAFTAVALGLLLYGRLKENGSGNTSAKSGWRAYLPLVVGMLPALFITAWMSNSFEYENPVPGKKVKMEFHSMISQNTSGLKSPPRLRIDKFEKQWPKLDGRLVYRDTESSNGAALRASTIVPVVTKKSWTNAFFGSPVGYIPDGFAIQKIKFGAQVRKIFPFENYWLSNWKIWFLSALALAYFVLRKVPGLNS